MSSGPITSWEIDGETVETVTDYLFGLQKSLQMVTVAMKLRCLLLGKKVMPNLDSIFREGDGTPLQYSCLENPMEGGAWQAAIHGIVKSQTQLSDFTFTHWRRKWQPTPVFLPGESQGRESLVGCRLCGRTELDTTEAT